MRSIVLCTLGLTALTTIHGSEWSVGQTFVINMKNDVERTANMRRQLGALQLTAYRIRGVDKKDLAAAFTREKWAPSLLGLVDNRIRIRKDPFVLTRPPWTTKYGGDLGAAAASISHAHALLSAIDYTAHYDVSDKPVLVLEDDIEMSSLFIQKVTEALQSVASVDPEWSYLAIGHCLATGLPSGSDAPLVARPMSHRCAHAYVLRNTAVARQILRVFLRDPEAFPVWDEMVSNMYDTDAKWNAFRVYAYVPNDIAVQDRVAFDQHVTVFPDVPQTQVSDPINRKNYTFK